MAKIIISSEISLRKLIILSELVQERIPKNVLVLARVLFIEKVLSFRSVVEIVFKFDPFGVNVVVHIVMLHLTIREHLMLENIVTVLSVVSFFLLQEYLLLNLVLYFRFDFMLYGNFSFYRVLDRNLFALNFGRMKQTLNKMVKFGL